MRLRSMFVLIVLVLSSVSGMNLVISETDEVTPILEDRADEAVTFTNVSETVGLPWLDGGHATFAWGDYNADDYVDLLIDTMYGPVLYENNGPPNWDFTNVTTAVGLGGPGMANSVWGDYDNDGYLDIYTTWWEENVPSFWDVLWHNSGPPLFTFTNVTFAAGNVTDIYPGKGNVWADVDRDGYLDMYVVNWRTGSTPKYKDYFWHNNGNDTFSDLSESSGIYDTDPPAYSSPPFAGMGITSGDYNNDGWMDIYTSNYLITPNYLWDNQRNLTFENVAIEKNAGGNNKTYYYGHSAGSAFGDYNNDGFMDIFVGNLAHKDPGRADLCDDAQLLENQGPPWWNFTDVRPQTGIPITPKGTVEGSYYKDEHYFSAAWADVDNDGDIDLFVPQVKNMAWSHTYLWRNNGDGTFTNITDTTGVKTWDSIAGAFADYNNDGFMDIAVDGKAPFTGGKRQVRLYKNNGNSNHWIEFRLEGTENNAPGIGSRVKIKVGNNIQVREVDGGSGSHGSQNSQYLHYGLGSSTTVDEVEVRWPNGNVQILTNLAADQIYDIVEDFSGPDITSISANKNVVQEDEEVTITATVAGSPSSYEWDLEGDGVWDTVSGTTSIKHTYTEAGTYYPGLRILDATGNLGEFQTVPVQVVNAVPTPALDFINVSLEDDTVSFDWSASTDTASDVATLEYNLSFGDDEVVEWSTDTSADHVYNISDTYQVTLQVRDDDEDIGTITKQLTVTNMVPVAITNHSVIGLEDSLILFNGSGSDTISDQLLLEFMWDLGDGGTTQWASQPEASHTYDEAGDYNASFSVRDDDGDVDTVPVNVTVLGVGPVATIVDLIPVVDEDAMVQFAGTASDTVSDTTFTYRWDLGDGNGTNWTDVIDTTHVYIKGGTYTVTFSVMDDDGLVGTDAENITVLNLLPSATIMEVPSELLEDEVGDFIGAGYDTPTDRLGLLFRWDFGDGTITEWSDQPVQDHSYSTEGDYQVRFEVKDDDDEVAFAEETLSVLNVVPDCTVELARDIVNEDDEVKASATCTDTASDSELDIEWAVQGKTYNSTNITLTFSSKGQYDIEFKAMDDEGGTYSEKLTVTVRNVDPSIEKVNVPREMLVDVGALFWVNATDTASDMDELEYSWDFGDGSKANGASVEHTYTMPGTMTVRVTVEDDDGAVATKEVTVKVTGDKKKPDDDDDGGVDMVLVGGGIGVAVIAVLLILVLFMRRKDKAPSADERIEEQEKEGPTEEKGQGDSEE